MRPDESGGYIEAVDRIPAGDRQTVKPTFCQVSPAGSGTHGDASLCYPFGPGREQYRTSLCGLSGLGTEFNRCVKLYEAPIQTSLTPRA